MHPYGHRRRPRSNGRFRSLHPGRSLISLAQTIYITVIALGILVVAFWALWKRVGLLFCRRRRSVSFLFGGRRQWP